MTLLKAYRLKAVGLDPADGAKHHLWRRDAKSLILNRHERRTELSIVNMIVSTIMRTTKDDTVIALGYPTKGEEKFTLSPDSILFLETVHRQQRAASASAVLDDIIQGLKRAQERDSPDRAVTNYYSGLSEAETEAQSQWGESPSTHTVATNAQPPSS
jgi:hypothetical protein